MGREHLEKRRIFGIAVLMAAFGGRALAGGVDDARLVAAGSEDANWLSYGRTYQEQRYSPLKQIDEATVKQLGLAWYADLREQRGQEATPLVVDGTLYVVESWDIVHAFDAKSGKALWTFDPEVRKQTLIKTCCDAVSRGIAIWEGKIYVATIDGRLIAVDASSGKPVWTSRITDPASSYTVTMAPRIVKGRVLIGVSGGEYALRGYLSAFDAATGKLDWRFFTVPGDPSKPAEQPILEKAAKTWNGDWWKRGGGGGPVWDGLSYDPELNLVYFGVGNGGIYPQSIRSPGGGDNWFLSSIVAVNADTGQYAWHFQATPGDEWDYDATQQLMQADLTLDGKPRKVVMQANKNGFYYVIDRTDGSFISAAPFATVTWAKGVDPKTGRPIEASGIRYDKTGKPTMIQPGPAGAHSWQAMSFNPATGLVYMPTQDAAFSFGIDPTFKKQAQGSNYGIDFAAKGSAPEGQKPVFGGYLVAWDPVKQQAAWRVKMEKGGNGGTLSTAGGLVFEGTVTGELRAYRATDGKLIWSAPSRNTIIAPPIAYAVDGQEYIAVLVGWGGANGVMGVAQPELEGKEDLGRLLVFKIGGTATLPGLPSAVARVLDPPPATASATVVANGEKLFNRNCMVCHGFHAASGGINPDLRYTPYLKDDTFFDIVLKGALQDQGMVSFAPVLSHEDVEAIRAFVIKQANDLKATTAPSN